MAEGEEDSLLVFDFANTEYEPMKLSDLRPSAGARKKRKRIGRGAGSGHGKTSGRGHKGQNSRSGGGVSVWSEGGQMPLQRRVPKRGFKSLNREAAQVVNVADIARKANAGDEIDPAAMLSLGLIGSAKEKVKILATGEIDKSVTVRAHAFSKAAQEKIEKAGGKAEVIA